MNPKDFGESQERQERKSWSSSMQLVLVPASNGLVLSLGKTDLQQLLTCSHISVSLSHIWLSSQNMLTHWHAEDAEGYKSVRDPGCLSWQGPEKKEAERTSAGRRNLRPTDFLTCGNLSDIQGDPEVLGYGEVVHWMPLEEMWECKELQLQLRSSTNVRLQETTLFHIPRFIWELALLFIFSNVRQLLPYSEDSSQL